MDTTLGSTTPQLKGTESFLFLFFLFLFFIFFFSEFFVVSFMGPCPFTSHSEKRKPINCVTGKYCAQYILRY